MWNDEAKFLTNFNIAPLAYLILTGISDWDLLLADREVTDPVLCLVLGGTIDNRTQDPFQSLSTNSFEA